MDSTSIAAGGSKLIKGKNKLQDFKEEEVEVGYKECRMLHIEIRNTEGLDRDTLKNSTHDLRVYRVLAGVGPGVGFSTPRERGLPDPNWTSWDIVNTIPLEMECKYLFVEVLKLWSRQDPGTSRGHRVVGRVAIPLPKEIDQVTCGRYGLVRQDQHGVMGGIGHINVAMKITKVITFDKVGDVDIDDPDDDLSFDDDDQSFEDEESFEDVESFEDDGQ